VRALAANQRGFTYLGLLSVVVIMGLMLTMVARVWQTTMQREREAQLLWVGHAYRMAISSYYAFGHRYPATLQELLTDERFPVSKHHLRRLYADPMTGEADWNLIMNPGGQGIMGVASSSQGVPIKRAGFDLIDDALKGAECYCAWRFVYYANRWSRPVGIATPGVGAPGTITPNSPGTLNPNSLSPLTPRGVNPFPSTPSPAGNSGSN
jgi:type II secretory pathway pseudopilin PulG